MKKLLMVTSGAVLIFGLAAATYAVDLKASGNIRTRTVLTVNAVRGYVAPDDPTDPTSNTGWDDTQSWVDSRGRLKFTLEASEDLKGVFYLEMGDDRWGVDGGIGQWGADAVDVEVKNLYVDFKVPGTDAFPTRATVGIQGWAFSPFLAIDEDGPGVKLATTAGPAAVTLVWRKQYEGALHMSDDTDSFGGGVSVPVGPVTPGVWSMYYDLASNGLGGATRGQLGGETGYAWYTGVTLDGKVGPVALDVNFVYGTQEIDYSIPYTGTGWLGQPVLYSGEEYSGFAVLARASIPINIFTVGGQFFYGTGDDAADIANDREYSGYYLPPGSGMSFSQSIVYYQYGPLSDAAGITGAPGQDWFVKGFASMKPLDWLKVEFWGMYIGDNVEHGDRFGDSVNLLGMPEDNDDAGIEVDGMVSLYIYDNLVYNVGAGMLFAGSAMDRQIPGYNLNDSPANPWTIASNLTYVF